MKVHPIGTKIFYNYIFKVTTTVEPFHCDLIIPEKSETPPEIREQILKLAKTVYFFENDDPKIITFVDIFKIENSEKGKIRTYFAYIQRGKESINILLSKYFHPRALKWPISFNNSLFLDLRSLTFSENELFEIKAKIPERPPDVFPNLNFIKSLDFSQNAEISVLYQMFLSTFPPIYMFQFIYYLFQSYKIFVVSSKIDKLTDIVFAINSFFYPLQKNKFLINTIPLISCDTTIDVLNQLEGPCIMGIPLTHLLTLGDFSPKSKHILFNIDIPYLILNTPPDEMKNNTVLRQKGNGVNNLLLKEHRETLNIFYQFREVFPTFHVQMKIAEFTIGFIKFFFDIKDDSSTGVLRALQTASKNPSYTSFFREGSLLSEFLRQLSNPSDSPELIKLYFPAESNTPQITVPQLISDFK